MHVYGMTRRSRKDVYKMTLFRLEIVANLFLSPLLLLLLFQFIAKIDYSGRSRSRAVLSSYLGIISKGSLNLLRVEMCRKESSKNIKREMVVANPFDNININCCCCRDLYHRKYIVKKT